MSNLSAQKVFIQIESVAEQQEHLKTQRKTLKVLQNVSTDKENLTGRPQLDKLSRLKAATEATLASTEQAKRKKVETRVAETQTSPQKASTAAAAAAAVAAAGKNEGKITEADLTSNEKPGENYWERLAEKRREALEKTLEENQGLYERVAGLEEELNISQQMLDEAKNLVETLSEMLNETQTEETDEARDTPIIALPEDDDASDSDSVTKSSQTSDLEKEEQQVEDEQPKEAKATK